jgi:hypothetical protein
MKQVVFLVKIGVFSLLLAVVGPLSGSVHAQSNMQMTQTILPLECTVDIVSDGLTNFIQLTPVQCKRFPEARQILQDAYDRYPEGVKT